MTFSRKTGPNPFSSHDSRFSNKGAQSAQSSTHVSQTRITRPTVSTDQLTTLSSDIINYIQQHNLNLAGLNEQGTKIYIGMKVNELLENTAHDNVSLEDSLEDICHAIEALPDFQPDATELFHALRILYSGEDPSSQQTDKKLKIAQSIASSYTQGWVDANKSLMETPNDLIKTHKTLNAHLAATHTEASQYNDDPRTFTLEQLINHPAAKLLEDKVTDVGKGRGFYMGNFMIKDVFIRMEELKRTSQPLNDIRHHEHYARFRDLFNQEYKSRRARLQETLQTTGTEINVIKHKLGLADDDTIDQLTDDRLQDLTRTKLAPFRDAVKQQLTEFGCKAFYARHALGEPVSAQTANASNSHYQSILMEHDPDQGYRVTIMDSLGPGKKTTSEYINDSDDVNNIIDNIARLSYSSNANHRIVEDRHIAERILPDHIPVSKETMPLDYRQGQTAKCGIQCVKNVIAEASGTDVHPTPMDIDEPAGVSSDKPVDGKLEAANPTFPMDIDPLYPLEGMTGQTKRDLDAISSSELLALDITKYQQLEAWAQTPDTPLNEELLNEFLTDFSHLLKAQKATNRLYLKPNSDNNTSHRPLTITQSPAPPLHRLTALARVKNVNMKSLSLKTRR